MSSLCVFNTFFFLKGCTAFAKATPRAPQAGVRAEEGWAGFLKRPSAAWCGGEQWDLGLCGGPRRSREGAPKPEHLGQAQGLGVPGLGLAPRLGLWAARRGHPALSQRLSPASARFPERVFGVISWQRFPTLAVKQEHLVLRGEQGRAIRCPVSSLVLASPRSLEAVVFGQRGSLGRAGERTRG